MLLRFYFIEKEMQEPLIIGPLYCKIMHLKAKRKFTLLVASNSDFVSANVILNQEPIKSTSLILACATDGTKLWVKSVCKTAAKS